MKEDFLLSTVLSEKELLKQLIHRFGVESSQMPEGKITRKIINGKMYLYQYFKNENGSYKHKILGKNAIELAERLKRKAFLQKSLPILQRNLKALDSFLQFYTPYFAADILNSLLIPPEKQQEYIFNKDEVIKAWLAEPYEKNKLYPEALIHSSPGGLMVRSKSEAIIAGLLEQNQIPFRYEAKLTIGEKIFYPDFTILKPKDCEIIYWEHFGMVHDLKYNNSMENKINEFLVNGMIPWENYIATHDKYNMSINGSLINKIIRALILDL